MKEASARCVRSSFLWAAEIGACWGTGRQCEVGSPGEKQAEGVLWFPSIAVGGWPGGAETLLALVCARLEERRWTVADAFSRTRRCVLECGRQGAVCWASERVLHCPSMYTHTHMYMVCASECWDRETASSWPLRSPPSTVPAHSDHAVNTCWSITCGMAKWLYQTDPPPGWVSDAFSWVHSAQPHILPLLLLTQISWVRQSPVHCPSS